MHIRPDRPFRGSMAIASGALTRGELYGPRYRRLYPDIHVPLGVDLDFAMWSRTAHELVAPRGVLAGYRRRPCPKLAVRLDAIDPHEIMQIDGVRLTTPHAPPSTSPRWAPSLTEAVVAVDALCHTCSLDPTSLLQHAPTGARGVARLPRVIALADPLAESPMESRIRLAIVLADLPPPVSQHPVPLAGRTFHLDLAYPP